MNVPILSIHLLLILLAQNANQGLSAPSILDLAIPVTSLDRLTLPSNTSGPESTAFDRTGAGPYTGVINGRILKWTGPSTGFVKFAVTSENWTQQVCESRDLSFEPICGSPLGLEFHYKTKTLYIADAYSNLRSVGPDGGVAKLLASEAEGVSFKVLDGLEVDQKTGVVYFTDGSSVYQKKDLAQATLAGDRTGRFMKYDPTTKQVTVLLRNLGGPVGAALSKDRSFILVTEYFNSRILRYWLKGRRANTTEIFYITPGTPDNVKRNADGNFWVSVSIGTVDNAIPLGILLSENGQVLRVLNFAPANFTTSISNVQEFNGRLYLGSFSSELDYIGVTKSTRG